MSDTDLNNTNSPENNNEFSPEEAFDEALEAVELHLESGRVQSAAKILNKILTLDPDNISALKFMAKVASLSKSPHAALPILAKILQHDPVNLDALNDRGAILMGLDDPEAAELSFRKLLKHHPHDRDGLNNLGTNLIQQKRFDEAEEFLLTATDKWPSDATPLYNLGVLTINSEPRNNQKQLNYFLKAIELKPNYTDAHINAANALVRLKEFDKAIYHLDRALLQRPTDPNILLNKGIALREKKLLVEALDCFKGVLPLSPNKHHVDYEIAQTQYLLGDLKAAAALYVSAVSNQATFEPAYFGLGTVLAETGQLAKAKEAFKRAKSHPAARHRIKAIDIITRDVDPWIIFREEYEALRSRHEDINFNWTPQKKAKELFIRTDNMSDGEIILLSRLIQQINTESKTITLVIRKSLLTLIQCIDGVDNAICSNTFKDKNLTDIDVTHLYALPSFLGLKNGNLPEIIGYIKPDRERKRLWDTQLVKGNQFNIGLSWIDSGLRTGPNQELKFSEFEPLLEMQGASFIGLSNTTNELQRGHLRDMDAVDISEFIRDKEDLLAAVEELDLIITGDTLTAHLAGALNKPVIVLLPLLPHWLWEYKARSSSYYPSAILLRQSKANDWQRPIMAAIDLLKNKYGLSLNSL